MAQTVSELLVKISSTGDKEVAENMERSKEAFEETADSAGEQLGMLEDFSKRWKGAMGIMVASLGVATAGLARHVPVLGEAFGAISGLLQALGLQVDNLIGPTLRPLLSRLWEVNNAIASAEGPLGTLIGAVATVAGVFSTLAVAAAAWSAVSGPVLAAAGAVSSALSILAGVATAVVGAVAAVVGVSAAVAAALVVAVAAVVAFAVAYITNFRGVRDKTNKFVGQIIKFFRTLVSTLITKAKELWDGVTAWVGKLTSDVSEAFIDLVSDAFKWGRSLIGNVIDGIRSKLSALRRAAQNVADTVRRYMPSSPAKVGPLSDLDKVGPGLVDTVAMGMDARLPRLERSSARVALAARPEPSRTARSGGGGGMSGAEKQFAKLVAAMQNSQVSHTFEVDGRELARSVTPMIGEGAVRSGATQVRR